MFFKCLLMSSIDGHECSMVARMLLFNFSFCSLIFLSSTTVLIRDKSQSSGSVAFSKNVPFLKYHALEKLHPSNRSVLFSLGNLFDYFCPEDVSASVRVEGAVVRGKRFVDEEVKGVFFVKGVVRYSSFAQHYKY